jgi:hypothetical protein
MIQFRGGEGDKYGVSMIRNNFEYKLWISK